MLKEDLQIVGERVVRYLIDHGAQKDTMMINPRPAEYITVETLCFELDIDAKTDWPGVKKWLLEHNYPLAYLPGKGHYLGEPGEEVLNEYYRLRVHVAYARRLPQIQERMRQIQRRGGNSWRYLERRYGVTDASNLEEEHLKRIKEEQNGKDRSE